MGSPSEVDYKTQLLKGLHFLDAGCRDIKLDLTGILLYANSHNARSAMGESLSTVILSCGSCVQKYQLARKDVPIDGSYQVCQ